MRREPLPTGIITIVTIITIIIVTTVIIITIARSIAEIGTVNGGIIHSIAPPIEDMVHMRGIGIGIMMTNHIRETGVRAG